MEKRAERRFHWQSALLLESVRRNTFTSWTVAYINPDDLARAGFFYLGTEDHVQCIFCQGVVGYWEQGDQPDVEHKKHFPNCTFITGSATGNVPRIGTDKMTTELFEFLCQYHNYRISSTKPKPHNTSYQTDSNRLSEGGQLAYPQFNTIQNRLMTYTRWPKDVGVEPDVLAEAGFLSTGLADWVQCFHCGGGLYGWRRGDVPLRDHAKYFPFCPFARNKLGEESIQKIRKEDPPPMGILRQVPLSNEEAELLLHHPIARRLLCMGLSKVSVREALRNILETRGVLCRTVTEALELVFDYEEKELRNSTSYIAHDGAPGHDQQVLPVPTPVSVPPTVPAHKDATSNNDPPNNNQYNTEYMRILEEVKSLKKQVIQEERRLMCRMCQKAKVAVVFQPCSHLHLCAECARPRDTCPSCGAIVRGTLKPIIG